MFCEVCWNKTKRVEDKTKREKKKLKKREFAQRITDKKLHDAFAKLTKDIYPLVCHACGKELIRGIRDTQACHFVERGKKIVTWDIRNVFPGCSSCNGFDQSHQYELGKKANIYWGDGTAEYLRSVRLTTFSWNQYQKNLLYELFSNPPQGKNLEETRKLILIEYLKIKDQ